MKSVCRSLLVWFVCVFFATSYASENGIIISDAWIPEGPPVSTNMAGYFKLENATDNTITLTGVSSPTFNMVEIHKTEIVDGLAKMVRQDNIDVSPGESLVLEPGSFHLMLMRPIKPLKDGDTVQLRISFEHKHSMSFNAEIVRPE